MPTYTERDLIINLVSNYRELVHELDRMGDDCPFDIEIDCIVINQVVDELNLDKEFKINA